MRRLFQYLFSFYIRQLSDKKVEKYYVEAGAVFGYAVSYLYMGECFGFKRLFRKWADWEAEYARRGYQTLSIDAFIQHGGYGEPLERLGIKQPLDKPVILHSKIYEEKYLSKVSSAVNLQKLMQGEVQIGHYNLPTTENHPESK